MGGNPNFEVSRLFEVDQQQQLTRIYLETPITVVVKLVEDNSRWYPPQPARNVDLER